MEEIPVDSKVECADGPCGKTLAVVVEELPTLPRKRH